MSDEVRRYADALDDVQQAAERVAGLERDIDKARLERDAMIARAVLEMGCTPQQVARATGYSVSLIRHVVGFEKTMRSRGGL